MIGTSAKSMICSCKCSKKWDKLSRKSPKNSLRKSAACLPKSSVARRQLLGEPCGTAHSRHLDLSAGHAGAFFCLIPCAETFVPSFVLSVRTKGKGKPI